MNGRSKDHDITIASPLAPEAVLDNLRARGREWRESRLPPALRKAGFTGVRITLDGDRFRLTLKGGPRSPYYPSCSGRVEAAVGGARVLATFWPDRRTQFAIAVTVILIFVFNGGGLSFPLFGLVLFGAFFAIGVALAAPWREGILDVLREAAAAPAPAPTATPADPA